MPKTDQSVCLYGLDEIDKAAHWVIDQAGKIKLWCLFGEMGAGKTTLIKEVCKQLGVVSEISSPTFSLVNEYITDSGSKIYHFDFYRIRSLEEVYDMGYEDYFSSDAICLMEWPEKIQELLDQEEFISFHLQPKSGKREIRLSVPSK